MSKVNKDIMGYDLVKDVVRAEGYERCPTDKLFAIRRGEGNYLERLAEVRENTRENLAEMKAKFNSEEYIIWWGTVNYDLDGNEDEIEFYWS